MDPASLALGIGSIAVGLFGTSMSLIGASKQKKLQQQASDEAAKAIAKARMAITKNVALERGIPTVNMDSLLKATAQQQKQAIEGLQASGQRAVIGGIPQVQTASEKVMEKVRGDAEKQLLAREDEIAKQEEGIKQQEINMLAAEGTGARMQEARAAQTRALQLGQAGTTLGKTVMSALGNEDFIGLFGSEQREYRKGVDKLMEGLPEGTDRAGFEEYLNTVQVDDGTGNMVPASQDQLIQMMNDPNNTLLLDYARIADIPLPVNEIPTSGVVPTG